MNRSLWISSHEFAGSARLVSQRRIGGAVGLVAIAALFGFAQQAQPPAGQVRTADQQFKNIQVLKGFPANQLVQSMHVIESSLGVDCEYCHDAKDRSKDDLEPKRTARKMISMVLEINKSTFNGEQVVTCYTCHHGSTKPVSTIVLPIPNPMVEQPKSQAPNLPSVEQILSKYVQALGGEQAIRNVSTRVIKATRDIPTGPGGEIPTPAQIEIDQKAPNLTVTMSRTEKFTLAEGFDGMAAWAQTVAGVVTNLPSPDQERAGRAADLYEPLNLKNEYTRMEVRGIDKIRDHDAYLIVGFPRGDTPEQLFFDTQTGMLVARKTVISTFFGDNPVEVYFDDYRDTGSGVKIPFSIFMIPGSSRSEMWTSSTMRIETVQDNVRLENVKFVRPQSKTPPGQ
jgi:photosynthetic reaction center cytochrome c subunit